MGRKRKKYPAFFYERLQKCINESGMSCVQIGEKIGKDRKAIYQYRDGITAPDAWDITQFCKLFSVSADWLLGLKESN